MQPLIRFEYNTVRKSEQRKRESSLLKVRRNYHNSAERFSGASKTRNLWTAVSIKTGYTLTIAELQCYSRTKHAIELSADPEEKVSYRWLSTYKDRLWSSIKDLLKGTQNLLVILMRSSDRNTKSNVGSDWRVLSYIF